MKSATETCPRTSSDAIEYCRENLPSYSDRGVIFSAAGSSTSDTPASGTDTSTSAISSGANVRPAAPSVAAPSAPCMKWHTGKGLYAIRGVSQRLPRSRS